MRTYLQTLHTRSERHKKNFALLVSAGCTLAIFSVWSFIRFASAGSTPAQNQNAAVLLATDGESANTNPIDEVKNAVTPFQDITSGMASTIQSIKHLFDGTANGTN